MKILHLTSHLEIGGIPRYILSLSKGLTERNHRVIIASGGGRLESQVETIGATHWRFPFHTSVEFSPQVFWGMGQLTARLRKEPVDIFHAHTRVGQVVADRISRRLQIPYVTTWHGIYPRRLGRRLWPCTGKRTIAISQLVHQHLLQSFHVPEEQIRDIYNGIDTAHYAIVPDGPVVEGYRKRWEIPIGQPVIGTIGRLAAGDVKGFDILLTAVSVLKQNVPDLQVLIVGDGPRRPFLTGVTKDLGLQDCVHFLGEVDDIRIPLALMDVFIFTSRWPEAFGLTLVEAMAAGKPVVATKTGAVPEVIRHNVEGWLIPPDDPSSMAEGITHLLRNRETASRFGREGQMRVREMFDLDHMVTEVEAVYQRVASKGK